MLRTNLLILLSLIVQINCQTCSDGSQYQYSTCSNNPGCQCLQYSFSSSMYVCALTTRSCGQFSRCQSPNDACQANEICLRHPNCDSLPLCFPMSTINEQSCPPVYHSTEPPIYTSNYTSILDTLDGQYTRPNGGSPGTYYEAIQLHVLSSGYYDLSSLSGLDTHGFLYNDTFYPSSPQTNLIAHNDDGAGGSQFQIPIYLQAGHPYTLVVTTHQPNSRGPFSVIAKGPGNIYFQPITSTTTTTTTTTSRPIIVSAFYNGGLSTSNPHYNRTGSSTQYYYQAFEIRVNETGKYTFTSSSSYDTYGYIYQGNFYPFLPQINMYAQDDDGASGNQFQVTAELRSDIKYILIFTTHGPNTFGSYSVTGRGPGHIYFNPIQQTF